MDTQHILSIGKRCTEEENAACSDMCPLRLDIRALLKYIREEKWDSAYQLYRKQSVFPELLARICDAPCRDACIRSPIGGGVELRLLERAVCEYAINTQPRRYAVPRKNASVTVVGAGLAGLTAALTLAGCGYRVELYEKEAQPGGRLWEIDETILPRGLLQSQLDMAAQNQSITVHYKSEIHALSECGGAAVLLAVGSMVRVLEIEINTNIKTCDSISCDSDFWLRQSENGIYFIETEADGKYLSPAAVIAAGKNAAQHADWFLRGIKTSPEPDKIPEPTKLKPDTAELEYKSAVLPAYGIRYTREEAREEAERCLNCHCLRCVKACELLKKYRAYPKKYINDVYQSLNLVEKFSESISKRQIYSCNLCGKCKSVCPESIDMGDIYLTSRRIMYKKGSLPPAFHEFHLNDMLFSNTEASLTLPGKCGNRYMFFPGCRLGAFLPNTVEMVYRHLSDRLLGQVALTLGCCGAPAYWAGMEKLHSETLDTLRDKWSLLGKPEVILACPSCSRLLRLYAPEIPQKMLWEVLNSIGLPDFDTDLQGSKYAVFDPCTAMEDSELKQSVRTLLISKGALLSPIRDMGGCCGYGGLISYAAPELLDRIALRRACQSEAEYVTYCINCRDTFLRRGKPARHLLELLFRVKEEDMLPSLGRQRENRRMLSLRLQGKALISDIPAPVLIEGLVAGMLDRQYILPEQVYRAVIHCEETKAVIYNEECNTFIGMYKEGATTYWVEYERTGSSYRLVNAYSHHMELIGIP